MITAERQIVLLGIPAETGASRPGCVMGPDSLRTAGLQAALQSLGHHASDAGNIRSVPVKVAPHANKAIRDLAETAGWVAAAAEAAYRHSASEAFPVFMGGDHSISAGTVAGIARRAREGGKRPFVLWLDAHSDFHTLETTQTGNLHGTPVAYFTGQPGFCGHFPPLVGQIAPEDILMMGIRSVDPEERGRIIAADIDIADMRSIDEAGVAALLRPFLERVRAEHGWLHVSLDVDFLDPQIAPAVGTTVPGGASFREAHLIMELLHECGLVASLDLAELNPFLDERGRTASLMVDLAASLFGRKVMDRPTRSF
jgi:arginase